MDSKLKIIKSIEDEVSALKAEVVKKEQSLAIQHAMLKKSQSVKDYLDKHNITCTLSDYNITIDALDITVMKEHFDAKLVISFAQTTSAETHISGSYKLASGSTWYDIKTQTNKVLLKRIRNVKQLLSAIDNFKSNIGIYIAHVNMLDRNIACVSHQVKYRSHYLDPTESYQ